MKKVLVTGAGGFVGGHLIEQLVEGGHDVYAVSYSGEKLLSTLIPDDHIFEGDLTDYDFTRNAISKSNPDIIFHLAAISTVHDSVDQAQNMLTTNTALQYNMLEATRNEAGNARFIAVCSANEYGLVKEDEVPIAEDTPLRPLNAYAVSKISQEYLALQYHLSFGLDVVRLRAFNHTGERQTPNFVIPAFAKQIAEIEAGKLDPVIRVGNLESVRDFSDVKDIARAYILASDVGKSGEVYNLGSGKGVRVQDILDKLLSLSTSDIKIERDESRMRPSDVPVLIADYTKFKKETGWEPEISLDNTLERVLNYWRKEVA